MAAVPPAALPAGISLAPELSTVGPSAGGADKRSVQLGRGPAGAKKETPPFGGVGPEMLSPGEFISNYTSVIEGRFSLKNIAESDKIKKILPDAGKTVDWRP